jgi:hypothetical protein
MHGLVCDNVAEEIVFEEMQEGEQLLERNKNEFFLFNDNSLCLYLWNLEVMSNYLFYQIYPNLLDRAI